MSATLGLSRGEDAPWAARILGAAGGVGDRDPEQAAERELQVRGVQLFLLPASTQYQKFRYQCSEIQ